MELISGILLPAFIDLINRRVVNSDLRFWVSALFCTVVGLGINYIDTSFDFENLRAAFDSLSVSIILVFGWAQLSYKAVYKGSRVERTILGE